MAIKESNTKSEGIGNEKLKILIYGPPGSGKTWFGEHMPKPYFISIDKGLIGAKARGSDVDYAEVDTFEDVEQVVLDITNERRAKGRETIILDHLTALTDPICDYVLQKQGKKQMDLYSWGLAVDNIKRILKLMLDLANRYHVIVIAHEQLEKNELRGGVWGIPQTIGKFSYHVGGLFDLYLYAVQEMYWEAGKRKANYVLHTVEYGSFKAKDRIGLLDTVEPNDAQNIVTKVMGDKNG